MLDSDSFSGPLGYFMAEFWKLRPRALANATKDFPDFGTVRKINVTGGAFEIDSVPAFNATSAYKLPKMSMPINNGRSVLFMNQRGYSNAEIYNPLEEALSSNSTIDPSALLAGTPTACDVGNRTAYIFGEGAINFSPSNPSCAHCTHLRIHR